MKAAVQRQSYSYRTTTYIIQLQPHILVRIENAHGQRLLDVQPREARCRHKQNCSVRQRRRGEGQSGMDMEGNNTACIGTSSQAGIRGMNGRGQTSNPIDLLELFARQQHTPSFGPKPHLRRNGVSSLTT